jgi:hypothetical protein
MRDQKTVHNQWTWTIAIGLNTLKRLYNYTRLNRAGRAVTDSKPYHTAEAQVTGKYPPYVSESGTAPAVELILPARGPSKLWNPSTALPGQSLLRRKTVSPHDHTDPPTDRVLSTTSLTPHPRPIQGGRFVR